MASTILVVDDSEAVRVQLRKLLEDGGFSVLEGCDGLDGLEKLKSHGVVDLVICDVNMPNLDGLAMVSRIRQEDAWKSIPILMLTTEVNAEMKSKAKAMGVKAWVPKPYVPEKLILAIKSVLNKKS